MKHLFKILAAIMVALTLANTAQAQLKLGANPTTINANALLEVESTNKGILLPRIALTSTTTFAPMTAHLGGMTVYNTATAGDVSPGYYYNDGTKWVRVASTAAGSSGTPWDLIGNAGISSANFLGSTNNASLRFRTNNTEKMIIDSLGNVGIGTSTPAQGIEIYNNNVSGQKDNIAITGVRDVAGSSPALILQRQRVTGGYLVDGDYLGEVVYNAYNGTNLGNGFMPVGVNAKIVAIADGTHSTGNLPTKLVFYTTSAGAATSAQRMVINNEGNVGIGTTAPGAKLHIATTTPASIYTHRDIAGNNYGITASFLKDSVTATASGVSTLASDAKSISVNLAANPAIASTVVGSINTIIIPTTNTVNTTNLTITGAISRALHQGSGNASSVFGSLGSAFFTGSGTLSSLRGGAFAGRHTGTGAVSFAWGSMASIDNSGGGSIIDQYGSMGTSSIGGSSTVTGGMFGVFGRIVNTSTNTVVNASGVTSVLASSGTTGNTGTITNYKSFNVGEFINTGTITNTYGYYAGNLTSGTQTNKPFSFYASDVNADNYFAGNVGIGTTTPTEKLDVVGNIYASGSITAPSDVRFKENIVGLSGSLQKVIAMRGVSYTHKAEFIKARGLKVGTQTGFIAQELEKVYPEFVSTGTDGYKSVDYARLTPVLVEAIKELATKNGQLETAHAKMEAKISEIDALKAEMASMKAIMQNLQVSSQTDATKDK